MLPPQFRMRFVEGRARPAVSGEMCLFWEHCACSLCGDPHGSFDPRRRIKWTLLGMGSPCGSCANGWLLLPSPAPLSRLPLSRGHTVITPCRTPFVLCTQIFQFELDTPHATHPRSYAKPFPPDPRHTYAVLFCGSFLRTLFLLRVARANVSRCTCDVLLTHDRRASPTHVAYSGMLPLSRLKFLKLLCPSLDLRLTLS